MISGVTKFGGSLKIKPSSAFKIIAREDIKPVDGDALKLLSDIRGSMLPVRVTISQISEDLYYKGCASCKKKINEVCS